MVLVHLLLQEVLVGDASVPREEQQEAVLQAPQVQGDGRSDASAPARVVELMKLVSRSDSCTKSPWSLAGQHSIAHEADQSLYSLSLFSCC